MSVQKEPACERLLRRPGLAALGCGLLTVVLTWPLAARLGSALPAGAVDLWQNVWNFWWWDTALREGRSPFWTPYLFHPTGVELVFHTHSLFNMLALPVVRLVGPEAAYGLCVLFSTWLTAFGGYLLARELTGSARAGLLAGLVFAFFPHRLEQTLEHLNLFSTQFLPLTLWAFVRLARKGGRSTACVLGLFFALNALCDWQLALMLTLLLAVVALVALLRPSRPRAAFARDLTVAGAVATLLTLPAAWPLLSGMATGAHHQKAPEEKGIDATFLLRPHFHHPLWGRLTREGYATERAYGSAGFVSYLGVVPLALAGVALARRAPGSGTWSGIFVASLVLALGAHPWWRGRLVENITLPFAVFQHVPLLSLLRVANRFLIPAGLALGVLAALGWMGLRRRSDARFAWVFTLVALDYLWLPYPLRTDTLSPFYGSLREGSPPGAVLDIPLTWLTVAGHNMRAQIVHGRPIAGGYVTVLAPEPLRAIRYEPALADLAGLAPKLERPLDRERLVALGFGVAVLHKDRTRGFADRMRVASDPEDLFADRIAGRVGLMSEARFREARRRFVEACGAPLYEDEKLAAFDLHHAGSGRSAR